jgi:hypothetical protein
VLRHRGRSTLDIPGDDQDKRAGEEEPSRKTLTGSGGGDEGSGNGEAESLGAQSASGDDPAAAAAARERLARVSLFT